MQESNIIVKGLKINYKVIGEGKPMLVLHGWPSSSEKWVKLAELLERQTQIIIPDLPGFGKSQQPMESWNMDAYVEWIREFCDQVPELKGSFYLLGHSFGGALAAKFAIKYNQRVKKLFLISAACVREKTAGKKILRQISKAAKLFDFIPYYEKLRKGFYRVALKSDYPYQSGIMKETYLKVISDDLSHKINFLKVPTIIIWGDKDVSTPLEQGEFVHQRIPHSTFIVLPGGRHSLQIEMPELLAEKLSANV